MMYRIIQYLSLCAILFYITSCREQSNQELVDLFDLDNYLSEIESGWGNQSVTKSYQSGKFPIQTIEIDTNRLNESLEIFNKYNINKPDYRDKYKIANNPGNVVYSTSHRNPKVKELIVFKEGNLARPDSISISYEHRSVIGQSIHHVSINESEIKLKRIEKYLFSDTLRSTLILSAGNQ